MRLINIKRSNFLLSLISSSAPNRQSRTDSRRSHFPPNPSVTASEDENGQGTETRKQGSQEAEKGEGGRCAPRHKLFQQGRFNTDWRKEKVGGPALEPARAATFQLETKCPGRAFCGFADREGKAMALLFSNASMACIPVKRCIRFWGQDSTSEIAFEVTDETLRAICPQADETETALLEVFDKYRPRIERAAAQKYARDKQSYIQLSTESFQAA